MFDAFVFDMDGVLIDTQIVYNKAYKIAGVAYGIESIDEIIQKAMGCNLETTKDIVLSYCGTDFDFDGLQKLAMKTYRDITIQEGIPVKSGAFMLLEYLKTNRMKVALASSTHRKLAETQLKETKLFDYFSVIVTGDMVKYSKPDPEIYKLACKELGVKPEDAVAFEDSPNGLISAHSAGMKAIMIPDQIPYSDMLKPYIYEKFNSLIDVLEALKKNNL